MRPEKRVQCIEHHTRFDPYSLRNRVEIQNVAQVFAVIDNQRCADGLSALRRTRSARQDCNIFIGGYFKRAQSVFAALRYRNTQWRDLINRGVARISAERKFVEQYLAVELTS